MNEQLELVDDVLCLQSSSLRTTLWVRAERISLMASVGIYRGEKGRRQEIILNISAEVVEPEFDCIDDAIDYRILVRTAERLIEERHFELIETIVRELGRRLIGIERVNAVEVELYKPAAITPAMASVRYRVERAPFSRLR